jgi:hypothetical protein
MQSVHLLWVSMVGHLNCLMYFSGILQYRVLKEMCLGADIRSQTHSTVEELCLLG